MWCGMLYVFEWACLEKDCAGRRSRIEGQVDLDKHHKLVWNIRGADAKASLAMSPTYLWRARRTTHLASLDQLIYYAFHT